MTPRGRFLAARLGYVAIVLLATATGLHFSTDLTAATQRLVRAFTPSLGWMDAIDGLRNTVLFAGLGVTWVMTSLSGRVRAEIARVTLVGPSGWKGSSTRVRASPLATSITASETSRGAPSVFRMI